MPLTRSASRSVSVSNTGAPKETTTKNKAKRAAPASEPEQKSSGSKKKRRTTVAAQPGDPPPIAVATHLPGGGASPALVPAVLSFSFADAKEHLIRVDGRFADLFERMQCRPFENLERVHPFRALVKSILGQQISWLAARSVNHKFIRLYDPTMPEKPTDYTASPTSFFPTPQQVVETDIATLRTAGLSGRKAEYVKDLASRFADGRLSTEKLIAADDEELAQMLIEVRGIGMWTVDMFAIFSLRRPDILPIGDLGVQRGLVRWFLCLHSPSHRFSISPDKVTGQPGNVTSSSQGNNTTTEENKDALPVFGEQKRLKNHNKAQTRDDELDEQPVADVSSLPPGADPSTPHRKGKSKGSQLPSMPTPFTPSINKVLQRGHANANGSSSAPLPEGLSVAVLKSRLEGKKKIKGAFLTPKEMEDLTECWRPYRSLGVYYMWALSEEK